MKPRNVGGRRLLMNCYQFEILSLGIFVAWCFRPPDGMMHVGRMDKKTLVGEDHVESRQVPSESHHHT